MDELNNFAKLMEGILTAGEGMNEMVKSLEQMAESMENKEAPAQELDRLPPIRPKLDLRAGITTTD